MIQKIEFAQARLQYLEKIHQLIDNLCHHVQLDESVCYAVRLSLEEAYVNLIDHGYAADQPGPVTVMIESSPDQIVTIITDHAPPFAPQDAPPPDLQRDVYERQIGGLGWHFIREMMDEIRYESDEENNRLTLVKRLHRPSPAGTKRERLEITTIMRAEVAVVALGGTIDALTATSVTEILARELLQRKTRIVIDLARVGYMSSAGVFALLHALKESRAQGGDLRIANAHKEVRKVLDLSGFSNVAKFYADVNAAVESFGLT